uniref:tRNA 2-thiouridine(34) synthase MnmA n=1 Tax=Buchnera aphidicola TaxID=9 RepID=UPI003F5CBE3A
MKHFYRENMQNKVIVAMSGGVDSSVAAWMLKMKNYHVEGVFMKNWEENDSQDYCHAKKDLKDVTDVCKLLNIPLHIINFSIEYWNKVFKIFLLEIKKGNTPNPDVLCNKEIKFKLFLKFAINQLQANFIATGHYARTKIIDNNISLIRGYDSYKDQSYFLYNLTQQQLKKVLFPIGFLKKSQVRQIAYKLNMLVAKKKDSTGICFIQPKKFNNFINRFINPVSGNIISIKGDFLGFHTGLSHYTLGQRKGLKIGGIKNKFNDPWYVIEKNINNNSIIVSQGKNNIYLMSVGLIANSVNWINKKLFNKKKYYTVKTRYLQNDITSKIIPIGLDSVKVLFLTLVSSITPGQSVVFYDNEICLGGGVISSRLPFA